MSKEVFMQDIVQENNTYIVSEILTCLVDRYCKVLPEELSNQLYAIHKRFIDEVIKDYPKNTDIGSTTLYERIEFIPYDKNKIH